MFLTHRSGVDDDAAEAILDRLEHEGVSVWSERYDLQLADEDAEIEQVVRRCAFVLVVVTPGLSTNPGRTSSDVALADRYGRPLVQVLVGAAGPTDVPRAGNRRGLSVDLRTDPRRPRDARAWADLLRRVLPEVRLREYTARDLGDFLHPRLNREGQNLLRRYADQEEVGPGPRDRVSDQDQGPDLEKDVWNEFVARGLVVELLIRHRVRDALVELAQQGHLDEDAAFDARALVRRWLPDQIRPPEPPEEASTPDSAVADSRPQVAVPPVAPMDVRATLSARVTVFLASIPEPPELPGVGDGPVVQVLQALASSTVVWLVGEAGTGKSVTTRRVVERLVSDSVPVLPIRLDREIADPDGDLGEQLGVPRGVVETLDEAYGTTGSRPVLVLDQLDALHAFSGNRLDLVGPVVELLRAVAARPHARVLIVSRPRELEKGGRLGTLSEQLGGERVEVSPLPAEARDQVLAALGVTDRPTENSLNELLRSPLGLQIVRRLGVRSLRSLDAATLVGLWLHEARTEVSVPATRVDDLLRRVAGFMASERVLACPIGILEDGDAVEGLATAGVLVRGDSGGAETVSFAHQALFDHVWVTSTMGSKVEVAAWFADPKHQDVFHRSLLRLALLRQRAMSLPGFVKTLRAILLGRGYRAHLQDVAARVLALVGDPTPEEHALVGQLLKQEDPWLRELGWSVLWSAEQAWPTWALDHGVVEAELDGAERDRAVAFLQRQMLDRPTPTVRAWRRVWRRQDGAALLRDLAGDFIFVPMHDAAVDLMLELIDADVLHVGPTAQAKQLERLLGLGLDTRSHPGAARWRWLGGVLDRILDGRWGEVDLAYVHVTPSGARESAHDIWREVLSALLGPLLRLLSEPTDDEDPFQDLVARHRWRSRHGPEYADLCLVNAVETALCAGMREAPGEARRALVDVRRSKGGTAERLEASALAAGVWAGTAEPQEGLDFLLARERLHVSREGRSTSAILNLAGAVAAKGKPWRARLEEATLGLRATRSRRQQGDPHRDLALLAPVLQPVPGSDLHRAWKAAERAGFARQEEDDTFVVTQARPEPQLVKLRSSGLANKTDRGVQRLIIESIPPDDQVLSEVGSTVIGLLRDAAHADPDRFVRIGSAVPQDRRLRVRSSIARGVSTHEAPSEATQRVLLAWVPDILGAADTGTRDGVIELLRRQPGWAWDEATLDALARAALRPDRPEVEARGYRRERNTRMDFETDRINNPRAMLAEATARLAGAVPLRLDRLREPLVTFLRSDDLPVRASALLAVTLLVGREPALTREVVGWLVEAVVDDGAFLCANDVVWAVHRAKYFAWDDVRPIIERMVDAESDEVAEAGAVQVAVATLAERTRLDGAVEWTDSLLRSERPAHRRGVASVLGHNALLGLRHPNTSHYWLEWLSRIFDDPDEEIVRRAGRWIYEVESSDLEDAEPIFRAMLSTKALEDAPGRLLELLVGSDRPRSGWVRELLQAAIRRPRGRLLSQFAYSPEVPGLLDRCMDQTQGPEREDWLNLLDEMFRSSRGTAWRFAAGWER